MKLRRHAAILRVVQARRVRSQEELRRALVSLGFDVTQATLSRDVHDLGLARLVDQKGAYYAQPDEGGVRPDFQAVLSALLTNIDGVGPLLVLRTANGSAGAVAVAIDQAGFEDVLGTVAGEDTLLVITRNARARGRVAKRLRSMLGA
jgi:transcriptional regulator of arginine metabolism